jgi:hypothetical protein
MDPAETLLAVEEIKKLKARYFETLDMKDWHGYAGVFTDDAVVDFQEHQELTQQHGESASAMLETDEWVFTGGKAVAEWLEPVLAKVTSVHHGHDPQISLTGPDTATGKWSMYDRLQAPEEVFHGYGYYLEEYRRVDGEWLISRLVLTRRLGIWERSDIVSTLVPAARH